MSHRCRYKVVGQPLPRIEALEKVTGKAVFGADVVLAHMLFAKALRSPHPHALIRRIDVSKALGFPGVVAAITGADFPDQPPWIPPVIVKERVLFAGQVVAVVAAESEDIAEEALELIEVDYEILPAVFDPIEAMQIGAPSVQPGKKESVVSLPDGRELHNISERFTISHGDVEKGFAEADVVLEETFTTPVVHQAYIEPHAGLGVVDETGKVTVWTTTQGQFNIRADLAEYLRMPLSKVKVIATRIGGGFGGKANLTVEPLVAKLAERSHRPVKMVLSREEEFLCSRPRPSNIVRLKTAARKDGTLTAHYAHIVSDTGAYDGVPLGIISSLAAGPYRIPNVRVEAYSVYTNKISVGAFRAPGAPEVAFAIESMMDMLAEKLQIDPLEIRLKNAAQEGDMIISVTVSKNGFKECLLKAAEQANWHEKRLSLPRGQGIGIAAGLWGGYTGQSEASVLVNEDGTVRVVIGAVDVTGTDTIFAQIAAEELGVPLEAVSVVMTDTDSAPYAEGSWGSRTVYSMGTAVKRACEQARKELLQFARQNWEGKHRPRSLELRDGKVIARRGGKEEAKPLSQVARSFTAERGTSIGRGTGQGLHSAPAFCAQIAEVEVDEESGQVKLHRLICAHDVGLAINPLGTEGQIEGGALQGIGYGLMEQYKFEDGKVQNPHLLDYLIPTAMDMPKIECILVEVPSEQGPYGCRGVGEPPIIPTAPAITNAIYHATRVRIKDLPATPEKIVAKMRGAR